MKKVITYQSPAGEKITLTEEQVRILEAAQQWPRDSLGQEYCSVSYGLHTGSPSTASTKLEDLLAL